MEVVLKTFYCLRCGKRFMANHDRRVVVERSCPHCASNSVRLETPAAARRIEESKSN